MPIFFSMPSQTIALRVPSGSHFGATASDRPFVPGGASGSRHSTRWTMLSVRSWSPPEMKIFVPLRRSATPLATAAPSAGSARVRTRPRSLPACGSVRFIVASHSPLATLPR